MLDWKDHAADLVPHSAITSLEKSCRSVGHLLIQYPSSWGCATAFAVAPKLILTARHNTETVDGELPMSYYWSTDVSSGALDPQLQCLKKFVRLKILQHLSYEDDNRDHDPASDNAISSMILQNGWNLAQQLLLSEINPFGSAMQ